MSRPKNASAELSALDAAIHLNSRNFHRRSLNKRSPHQWLIRYHFRRPKGAGSYLILLLMILFFGYQENALYKLLKLAQPTLVKLEQWQHVIVNVLIFEACPKLLYPFAGWLADAKFGRHKVLRAGICITWISAVILLLVSVLSETLGHFSTGVQVVVVLIYLFTATGTAFFHANIIPFGIDQMEDCSSEEMSSFVHWYYWAKNVNFGAIIQLAVSAVPSYCTNSESYDRWVSLAQVALLTLAVCLIFVFSKNLKTDSMIYNPIRKVKVITKYVIEHERPMGYRSAHTYLPELCPSRFDFSKKSYGGIFEEDDVEEVVTFWRFMVFLVPIGIASTLYFMSYYLSEPVFHHMAKPHGDACIQQFILTTIVPFMIYLISIPTFEFVICPFFRKHIPQMRVKIGLGMLAYVIGFCYLLAVDATAHINTNIKYAANAEYNSSYQMCFLYNQSTQYGDSHLTFSPYTLVPFTMILVIGELLIFLTVTEFICAQAPGSMRSFLISIYFFVYGISAILMSLILLPFGFGFKNNLKHLPFSCGSIFFAFATAIGVFGLIIYIFTAKWYKNRQRGGQNNINYQTVVEGYYEQLIAERERRQSTVFDQTTYYNL